MYSTLCIIKADVSRLGRSLTPLWRNDGLRYHIFDFDVVLSFGLVELTAQICWREDVGSTIQSDVLDLFILNMIRIQGQEKRYAVCHETSLHNSDVDVRSPARIVYDSSVVINDGND